MEEGHLKDMITSLPNTIGFDDRIRKSQVHNFWKYIKVRSKWVKQYNSINKLVKVQKIVLEEAAGPPLTGLTAIQAVWALKENDRILIHAGSGGVGSFVICMLKQKELSYILPPAVKCRLGQSFGADRVIDYKRKIIKRLQTIWI
jgi:NADPH:quinone reductase-like Zn-dependent oxidoreductase